MTTLAAAAFGSGLVLASAHGAHPAHGAPAAPAGTTSTTGTTGTQSPSLAQGVQVHFVDDDVHWGPGARAAVRAAAQTWARTLDVSVPIRVRATAGTIDGIYGYANPVNYARDPGRSPAVTDDVLEPVALANARSRRDATPGQPHIEARFDLSRSDLYLGTDGRTPRNKVDLETLALHELGHGLGFAGSPGFGSPATLGREGAPGTSVVPGSRTPFSYDRFTCTRTSPGTCTPMMSLPDGSSQLEAAFQNGRLYWSGKHATAANGGRAVKLYAPPVVQGGATYVHLDESTYLYRNSLMTPYLTFGAARQQPGPIAVAMLADMGWPLR